MTLRNRLAALLMPSPMILAGAALLFRTLALEEARPAPSMYPRVAPPPSLLKREKEYLAWLDGYVQWLVSEARSRMLRHRTVLFTAGFAALALPPAVALDAPKWAYVALSTIQGLCVFVQVASHDQKLYLLHHEQSCRLQRLRRDFSFDTSTARGDWDMRLRFKEFREAVERVKEEYGARVFEVRGKEPPQMPQTVVAE
jgi:hypothetical protein